MMSTVFKIENGIPLHEAAAFFLKLKTAAPDETGVLEGQFAAPIEEVLEHMALMVQNELKTHYAYIVYSQSLRDLAHHSIAQELQHHAQHETEHAEFLLRRMSVLGGAVEVPDIPAPPPSSDPVEIIKTMIQMEQEGIANWQHLRKLVGEDNPTRFKIEEYLTKEQEHLDELWQLLPHAETAATAGTPPAVVDPQAGAAEEAVVTPEAAPEGKTAASFEEVQPYALGHGFLNPLPGSGYGALAGGLMTEGDEKHPALRGAALGALTGGTIYGSKALGIKMSPREKALLAALGAVGGAIGGAHAAHAVHHKKKSEGKAKTAAAPDEAVDTAAVAAKTAFIRVLRGEKAEKEMDRIESDMAWLDDPSQYKERLKLGPISVRTRVPKEKKASARVERFHPDTLRYHGAAMKLALASKSPTVFVPEMDLEGNLKEAAAKGPSAEDLLRELRATPTGKKYKTFSTSMRNAADSAATAALRVGRKVRRVGRKAKGLLGPKGPLGPGTAPAAIGVGTIAALAALQRARRKAKGPLKEKKSEGLPDAAQGKVLPPPPPPPPLSGPAAGQHTKLAERFKRALSEMGGAPTAPPVPGGEEANELEAYLAEESAAQQAQDAAERMYYRERFIEAMQRLQAAEQQVQQLQEQVAMSSEMNQQALAQAQQIQEQAMQQVNAANAAAAAAMQKSLAASNETLQQQQLATQMRDAMQGLKQQLMGIVNTQLPPSTTMEAGGSAYQAAADQQAQEQALMGGQDPGGNQAGTPAASGDAGTPPGSSTPGKDGPGVSPTASDPSSSPAAEIGYSESAPGETPEYKEAALRDRLIGGLVGAGIGAGVTAIENRSRGASNEKLRSKVQKLEAAEQSGSGSFGNALNIAQAKMRLAAGELAQKHPTAAIALGAALGARAGSTAGPIIRELAHTIRG
jgi:bacterioferritin (cytochrome b1)